MHYQRIFVSRNDFAAKIPPQISVANSLQWPGAAALSSRTSHSALDRQLSHNGARENILAGPSEKTILEFFFLKKRTLVYIIFLSNGGAPKRRGARRKHPPYPSPSTGWPCTVPSNQNWAWLRHCRWFIVLERLAITEYWLQTYRQPIDACLCSVLSDVTCCICRPNE